MWGVIIILVLLFLALALLPTWPYSRRWGYAPFGGTTLLLIAVLLLAWFGFIGLVWPWGWFYTPPPT